MRSTMRMGLAVLCLFAAHAFGQPPAQGPPPPPPPALPFATSILVNFVKTNIQTTLDEVNAKIVRDADSTGVRAHLSFTLKSFKPGMSTTTFPNKPNENIVRIAFMISYDVTGIRYHGIPYFSRKLGQSLELHVSCNQWFTNAGTLAVTTRADRPFLDNKSFAEEALNFFIANTLTNLVDSKLRARLPSGSNSVNPIPTSPCNCLSVNSGTPPNFTDAEILFKKVNKPIIAQTVGGGSVTIQSIKRLKARPLAGGGPLYQESENIQLEMYVNQTLRTAQLNSMREGDIRTLNIPVVPVSRPGVNGTIVLIANVTQLQSFQNDTRFAVFGRNVGFGNGTQKITVPKIYTEPPRRLSDGTMTKPTIRQVDAYEVTVTVALNTLNSVISK